MRDRGAQFVAVQPAMPHAHTRKSRAQAPTPVYANLLVVTHASRAAYLDRYGNHKGLAATETHARVDRTGEPYKGERYGSASRGPQGLSVPG